MLIVTFAFMCKTAIHVSKLLSKVDCANIFKWVIHAAIRILYICSFSPIDAFGFKFMFPSSYIINMQQAFEPCKIVLRSVCILLACWFLMGPQIFLTCALMPLPLSARVLYMCRFKVTWFQIFTFDRYFLWVQVQILIFRKYYYDCSSSGNRKEIKRNLYFHYGVCKEDRKG